MQYLQLLVKPASSLCDLKCTYCFYHDLAGHQTTRPQIMSTETFELIMKRAAEYFADASQAEPAYLDILFQGGEPTMAGLEFFENAVKLQKWYFAQLPQVQITRFIQTNASRIPEKLMDFLVANDFNFGVSLDGPQALHDAMRVYSNGRGSFDRVMDGIKGLKARNARMNVLCVLTDLNALNIKEVYAFFRSLGFEHHQYIACLDPFDNSYMPAPARAAAAAAFGPAGAASAGSGCCDSGRSAGHDGGGEQRQFLSEEAYGRFLIDIFDVWYDELVNKQTYVSVRHIENYICLILGMDINACNMNGVCHVQNVVESSGEVYPCDFFAHDDWSLGNLKDKGFAQMMHSDTGRNFVKSSLPLPEDCRTCPYLRLCRNGCLRERVKGKNRHCKAFKTFFDARMPELTRAAGIMKNMR
ncbi:SPASM domain-containing protein [Anaerobiospirillum sp. NML120449]|uniref:radical SAM/SPASM domain-containing protein n=1 Tax=Anaerobiospirillum sp. NML120449 TaxID=2932817 RepID=UPI001FF2537B|nr:SPASM domain-containing protein [Anaerobiospirillum sp. NML120449]MCK0526911.1 SPASM domain-containing protein [Anaerobiospirillum sp. NML120449]